MDRVIRVLVVEDGDEYIRLLQRFGSSEFSFVRAGDGADALARLAAERWDVVFLDMRFDRVPAGRLLGDLPETTERFDGDPVRARVFLEDHQGTYILAAIRAAGDATPAVFSHDFDGEPRRWANLDRRYAPVRYLPDNASAATIGAALRAAAGA